ncbi:MULTISPECIES: complex I subunit 4 family protein [Pseudonocardia]|uniref:NADH-quinone oxidoreductase subunit M n=2 Tax=Pseudonocardia TaxID=1847 RepID=A0A1Y2MH33_PSEAH|nr:MULTISPECIES: NADH-quinone oxidoreductase subunit M [Pseudonocardia]OSY34595.1 NADH-quinone oxidoreductase subunit M [Pseudonocardia autotrophica]TDN65554.1 NADH dehydrogenase subunit M [Pseudonocardia autotrophica]BBG05685.1 NADH-quinone oxidoreductase subunit M [Pseudonocardia autotrophica]GEC29629.1 NADH-quinone oxidoreductase subunit M [Pseudonocardia saturnea]
MLSLIVFLPALVAVALCAVPARAGTTVFASAWLGTGLVQLGLIAGVWSGLPASGYGFVERYAWIPSAGVSYHLGVDGLSLPLLALTAIVFTATAVYTLRGTDRPKGFVLLFLALQAVSAGLFVALDLILFFLFFDLSIVFMYFVIAGWGTGAPARRAALTFFLYTFLGSLALLLGFILLALAGAPPTFDIPALVEQNPLAGGGGYGALTLLAIGIGLAVKTPLFPFHTWLPPAHTEAPAAGSAILAAILLKMGTYGFVRIAMPLLPASWRQFALVAVILGVISVLWGALVALAQTDLKRMIAYTSINHMGYVLLGLGAAGLITADDEQARQLATAGATYQMVSHGLITAALFLLAGSLHERGHTYDMTAYGGLATRTPRFAGLFAVAAFASLGLPGFSGFIAEFQIFAGALGAVPVATVVAVTGVLLTAALFLLAMGRMLSGEVRVPDTPGTPRPFPDLDVRELLAIGALLVLATVLGLLPRVLLDVIEPAARTLGELVTR